MSSVPAILGLPPGVHFRPDGDELVDLYLLPRARSEPAPFHGVAVLDDDAAGSTLPEDLLDRHGRAGDLDAYFFVRGGGGATKPGARQDRGCVGGGTWKSQKRVGCEKARYWSKHNLNLHLGRGESGGSVGWVMHEYTLTDPSCPPIKICHISFSDHGRNSKRVPGGGDGRRSDPAPTKRARVDVAAGGGSASSGSGESTTTVNQDYSATAQGMAFAASADAEPCCFMAAAPAALQQVPEHFMVQDTAGMAGLEHPAGSSGSGGSTTKTVDQDYYSGVGHGSTDHRAPPAPQAALTGQEVLDQFQWVDDLISDGLPDMAFPAPADAGPCCFEEQVVSQAAAPPATEQQVPEHFMPMVQETAGMAELDHPYLYREGEDQQEFLAPMGATVDEFGDVSSAQASATRAVVSWEGYEIELY